MKMLLSALVLFVSASPVLAQDAPAARPNPPVLKEVTSEFPKGEQAEYRIMTATLQPGSVSPWHTHSAPVAVYVVNGTFTLEKDGGESISLKAGEALLEPINVKVRAANRESEPATVVIFQVSDPQQPFMNPTE